MSVTDVQAWLLDSDTSLRWQAERDLVGAPPQVWEETRRRVATEGFGARLLALQDDDGQWAGGTYFPSDATREEPGQPWTATTWSLNALREWGLDAAVLRTRDTVEKLARTRWDYDDLPFWGGEVDVCINGYTLANGVWLGADVAPLAAWFVEHQLADGGWNCEWVEGATASSIHSTLHAIEALLAHEIATGGTEATRAARRGGEEYLLERHLWRRRRDGRQIDECVAHFTYPYRWVYNVLSALDHFRAAALHDGVPPDPRLSEAVEMVRAARQPDGTWLQGEPHEGRVWFDVDAPTGQPSKWLTFHASRVLAWWDHAAGEDAGPRSAAASPAGGR
ncbi:MAG TPA: squalene cyclase [Actinomycetes bacterium]|nr:squalene cyclase [Actinomycetes bacterium]